MKIKNMSKRLTVNKETVAVLTGIKMEQVKGGVAGGTELPHLCPPPDKSFFSCMVIC